MPKSTPRGAKGPVTSPRATRRSKTTGDHQTDTAAVTCHDDGAVVTASPAVHWPAWTDEVHFTITPGL